MVNYVLVADDVLVNRKLMKSVLKKLEDVEFIDAANGIEALEIITQREIDLVILDLMMPDLDGFGFLKAIKEMPNHRDIPVIVSSALDDENSIGRALDMGAYDYFTKPLSPMQIKVTLPLKVKNALDSYHQKRSLSRINSIMRQEMRIAGNFQNHLVPSNQDMGCVVMFAEYHPAIEVGGDFFDIEKIGGAVWFIIADVSGHGVASAMIASMIKVEFRSAIANTASIGEVFTRMNVTFSSLLGDHYITAILGRIHGSTMSLVNAGHPNPYIYRLADDTIETFEARGKALGMFADADYDEVNLEIQPGDCLILFTDGLVQGGYARQGNLYGDKLLDAFLENRQLLQHTPETFINKVILGCDVAGDDGLEDDVALMVIKVQ
ncbi:MAG: PP2C family protein-serine/threonine phosphatase [Acidobacteriota bacterium]